MKKRFFSLLLAVALVVGLLPVNALATGDPPQTRAATEKTISSQDAWESFVTEINQATSGDEYTVTLSCDINVSNSITTFKGTFDGNGHTVSGNQTLFSTLAADSVIQNTMFLNGASICGTLNGTIENCAVIGGGALPSSGGTIKNSFSYTNNSDGTVYKDGSPVTYTNDQFSSGEVCAALTGWYQNIGGTSTPDAHPVLDSSHGTVHSGYAAGANCGEAKTYSNDTLADVAPNGHNFPASGGKCQTTDCSAIIGLTVKAEDDKTSLAQNERVDLSATLTADFNNTLVSNATYKWYVDSQEISGATNATYTFDASGKDAGKHTYYCVYTYDPGNSRDSVEIKSTEAEITVEDDQQTTPAKATLNKNTFKTNEQVEITVENATQSTVVAVYYGNEELASVSVDTASSVKLEFNAGNEKLGGTGEKKLTVNYKVNGAKGDPIGGELTITVEDATTTALRISPSSATHAVGAKVDIQVTGRAGTVVAKKGSTEIASVDLSGAGADLTGTLTFTVDTTKLAIGENILKINYSVATASEPDQDFTLTVRQAGDPIVTLAPNTCTAGQTVSLQISNATPSTGVTVSFSSNKGFTPNSVTGTTDGQGHASIDIETTQSWLAGPYGITVTYTDSGTLVGTENLIVSATPRKPIVASISPIDCIFGESFTVTVTDAEPGEYINVYSGENPIATKEPYLGGTGLAFHVNTETANLIPQSGATTLTVRYEDTLSQSKPLTLNLHWLDVNIKPIMSGTNVNGIWSGDVVISPPTSDASRQWKIKRNLSDKDWENSITISPDGSATQTVTFYLKDFKSNRITNPQTVEIPRSGGSSGIGYDLSDPKLQLKIEPANANTTSFYYNGAVQKIQIRDNSHNGRIMQPGTDYNIHYAMPGNTYQTDAGIVEITLDGIGLYSGTLETQFEILPRPIGPKITGSTSKIYDKGTTCDGKGLSVTMVYDKTEQGILDVDADEVTPIVTYAYESADAGPRSVIATVTELQGAQAHNYSLEPATTKALVGEIKPRELEVSDIVIADKEYDAETNANVKEVKFTNLPKGMVLKQGEDEEEAGADFIATGTYDNAEVGNDKPVEVTVQTLNPNISVKDSVENKSTHHGKGNIIKATPQNIPWPTKLEGLKFGTTLGNSGYVLDTNVIATGAKDEEVTGRFAWKTPDTLLAGGSQKYTLLFEPTGDSVANYAVAEKEIDAMVAKGDISIVECPTAKAIEYGQLMTATEFEGGEVSPNVDSNGNEMKGKWEWAKLEGEEKAPTKAGTYQYPVVFVPENDADYASVSSRPDMVELVVKPAKAKIKFSPADASVVKSGTTITVGTTIRNPHNDTLKEHLPQIAELTYKIGDGEEQTIGKDGKFKIPDDTPEETTVVITAKTAAVADYYAETTATATLSVTRRDLVKITAPSGTTEKKKIYYNGSGHDGHGALRFYDAETEDEIKNFIKGTDYTISWRDSSGKELKTAPVYPGKYEFMVHVDTNKYAGTSEWVEFVIEKKPLEWKTNSLTAIKAVGNDKEIPVTGTLGIKGTVNKDKVEIPADYMKDLITSGFADKTEAGEYKDVTAVPKNGKTWNEVLPALDYYVWPSTNPGVKATILPKAEEGEKLYVDLDADNLSHSLQKLKEQKPNSTDSTMRTAMKGEIGSNFKTSSNNTTTVAQKFFDVTLMVEKEDGSLEEATAANFPSSGKLKVRIKYSDLTAKNNDATSSCAFEVVHMFVEGSKAGEMETIKNADIKKETDGIVFEVSGLSPLLVAWSKKGGSSSSSNGSNNNNSSTNKPSRPSWDDDDDEEYRVRVYSSSGGKVTASPRYAEEDETVTLKITPDNGYVLNKVTVENKRGKTIRVRERNGKYTFTMPDEDVEVDVSFSPIFSPITQPIVTTPSTSTGNLWTSTNTTTSVGSNCTYGSSCPSRTYSDLNASMWYHEPVDFAIQRGLMTGLPDGRFAPYSTLSRAMIVQILYTHAGKPAYTTAANFNDVDSGAWYESAVYWAVSSGVAQGVGDGMFSPSAPVTREQLAVMLRNYASNRGISLSSSQAAISFTDRTRISSWATDSVSTMQRAGIISGKEGNMFEPKGTASRVEAAQMLWKLLK